MPVARRSPREETLVQALRNGNSALAARRFRAENVTQHGIHRKDLIDA